MRHLKRFELIYANHDGAGVSVNVYSPSYNDGEFIRQYEDMDKAIYACCREAQDLDNAQAIVDLGNIYSLPSVTLVARREEATPEEIQAARSKYGSHEVQVDNDAEVSSTEDGAWVSAWVWVDREQVEQ
jgi:hypothetical protein